MINGRIKVLCIMGDDFKNKTIKLSMKPDQTIMTVLISVRRMEVIQPSEALYIFAASNSLFGSSHVLLPVSRTIAEIMKEFYKDNNANHITLIIRKENTFGYGEYYLLL